MKVERQDVVKLTRLASLYLSEDEIKNMQDTLEEILSWMNELQSLDTSDVENSLSASAQYKILETMRDDVVDDGNIAENVLKNAPDRELDYFSVPKVLE